MRLRQLAPRALRRRASALLAAQGSRRLRQELAALAAGRTPIVVGPWLGEVGFELLYWVPFVRWFAEQYDVDPRRLLVLSRGGTAMWYHPFAAHYADAFDQVSPDEFRQAHDHRVAHLGEQKQRRVTEFERQLVARATAAARVTTWAQLHPSRMYELFDPYWWGHLGTGWVRRHVVYRRLPSPPVEISVPREPYAAVKFYFNECFPPTAQNRAAVQAVMRQLTARGPVFALTSGLQIDDHAGVAVEEQGVLHLPEGLSPARNLLVQSAVVAGAREFVGTYGGFSYLAPFYGVPATAFYSDAAGYAPAHLVMAQDALATLGGGATLRVRDVAEGVAA